MNKTPKKRLVILDTHAILHRAYHALPDFASSRGQPTGALFGLVSTVVKIATDLSPDYMIAAFDLPGPTHRHIVYEAYKAHRTATDDALVSQLIRSRDVLDALSIPRYECDGYEADDVIGTIAEDMKHHGDIDVIIASGDMDMLQLVDDSRVRVFTFKKGLNDTILYDETAIMQRFGFGPLSIPDLKGIMGDSSDNIKGVPGVGEGSAMKLIKTFGTIEALYAALKSRGVEEVAQEAGIQKRFAQLMFDHEEDAEFSKMLATIRRDAPINFSLPMLWSESISVQKAVDMLLSHEFRSLVPRVKGIFAEAATETSNETPIEDGMFWEDVDPEELRVIGLAAWVLDSNVTQPTLEDIYRVGNANTFADAKEAILKEINERKLAFVYEKIELPLRPVLREMEAYGVKVDRVFLGKLSVTYKKELDQLASLIYKAAGVDFNINSPKQLGDVLFDQMGLTVKNQKKTATGARSTKESELEKMRELHPIIAYVLSYRELQKLLSTYIDVIPTLLDARDHLHTTYVQEGSTTGRLASLNPNLQNIPIKTELGRAIRHGFISDEGMELVSFDYSQIELRIAAFLSNDKTMVDIFKNGRDVHTEVAMRVFHVEAGDVTYEQRRRAKVINFGILYGMGVNALKESLGTARSDAQEFYNQYFEAFPRLAEYLEETKADATRRGYTETYFGRRRYFEGIKSSIPFVRAGAERMAINAPIQGTSADLIKLAMVEIGKWIKDEKLENSIHMLLQVHDELVFEITTAHVAAYAARIKDIMENALSEKERHGIPFKVEGKSGKNWGDMQELSL